MSNYEIASPISAEEILRGVYPAYALPQNEVQSRAKPRASGLMSDAREIAYMMAGVPITDPMEERDDRRDGRLTAEQGRMAESLTYDDRATIHENTEVVSHMAIARGTEASRP